MTVERDIWQAVTYAPRMTTVALARRCGCSEHEAWRVLAQLHELGYVTWRRESPYDRTIVVGCYEPLPVEQRVRR